MLPTTTLARAVSAARKVALETFVATHAPFLIVLEVLEGDDTGTTGGSPVARETSERVRPPPGALVVELAKPGSEPLSVGRGRSSDIALVHHSVSKAHGWIVRGPPGTTWRVCDPGSTNGTFVDGARVPAGKGAFIADDVQLGFGEVRCRFLSPAAMHALALRARPLRAEARDP